VWERKKSVSCICACKTSATKIPRFFFFKSVYFGALWVIIYKVQPNTLRALIDKHVYFFFFFFVIYRLCFCCYVMLRWNILSSSTPPRMFYSRWCEGKQKNLAESHHLILYLESSFFSLSKQQKTNGMTPSYNTTGKKKKKKKSIQ
jgi:hypothetical protein